MKDREDSTSEELLMLKDKIEEEDSEWLFSAALRVSQRPHRTFGFYFIIFLPWALLALLGTWDVIQYQRRLASSKFIPSQQVYS